jgi:uncharacterized membrane protein
MEFTLFILRWIHFLAGITWIGILYYFNFVQTPFFGETDPAVRTGAIQKLVPRALWWFRWGAMFTFLAGILIYIIRMSEMGAGLFYASPYGLTITVGGLLGIIMFLNVWLVIWPAQQVVIASTNQVASGGQALPAAPVLHGAGRWRREPTRFSRFPCYFTWAPPAITHRWWASPVRGRCIGSSFSLSSALLRPMHWSAHKGRRSNRWTRSREPFGRAFC